MKTSLTLLLAIVSSCQSQLAFPQSGPPTTRRPTTQRPVPSSGGNLCGRTAQCVTITRCPELQSKTVGNNIAGSLEVRQAVCGISNGEIQVCCRNPIRTTAPPVPTRLSGESLLPTDCGKPSIDGRIVGGEEAPLHAYPWISAILLKDSFGNEAFECSASVINSRYLITAAHCVDAQSLGGREIVQVNIGDYDIGEHNIDCRTNNLGVICLKRPHIVAKPERIIVHPDYDRRLITNDIALIRIDQEIDFEEDRSHIGPVCLPEGDFSVRSLNPQATARAIGWGLTENRTASNILLQVDLPFADRDLCRRLYRDQFAEDQTQLCVGGKLGEDSCPGDSGGPLMIPTPTGPPYTMIGIVSIGPQRCGLSDFPAMYTDVSKYRQWILNNLQP